MRRIRVPALLLCVFLAAAAAGAGEPKCLRVLAVGDVHGGYDALVTILRAAGVLDEESRWIADGACLVQLGDIVDRGPRSREALDLLMDLERQAPGRVHVLLGNHEAMNVTGDLRYTHAGEFAAFANEEDPEEREEAYAIWLGEHVTTGHDPEEETSCRETFDEEFPPGWFAHRRAFSPDGKYGAWLLEKPVLELINKNLFVHGGLSVDDARTGIRVMNRRVTREIRDFNRYQKRLVNSGDLDPLAGFSETCSTAIDLCRSEELGLVGNDVRGAEVLREAGRLAEVCRGTIVQEQGPLWNRDLAVADEQAFAGEVEKILRAVGASRIVVGHTPMADHRIHARFDARVYLIDTGAGPYYGGHPSALEITDGRVRAIYPGETEVLAEPSLTDADVERILRDGTLVESKGVGVGTTRRVRLRLEHDGPAVFATFKSVDAERVGRSRHAASDAVPPLAGDYRYERAAYLLDRYLGIRMVPVAVIRKLDGKKGALIHWIEDAENEVDLQDRDLRPSHAEALRRQRSLMHVLDALILNTDRNLGNQRITRRDWRLHLIDHSRAFPLEKALPEAFVKRPASAPRSLVDRLAALDERQLRELLRGLVSHARVRALMARRDLILEKIAADREKWGDDVVFWN